MTGMTWPDIKARLEAEGLMTNGVGRRVQARTCRDCHAPVLAGYDGDVCARVCHVDPDPLDAVGEALAVLTGRYTVGLWRTRDRFELQARDPFAIRGAAGRDRSDVLAEHRCGAPALPTTESVHSSSRPEALTAPPF